MNLIDFYSNMVESVGFTISENGGIISGNDVNIENDIGVPIMLPTKDNLNSILAEDGKVQKIMFNPLIEDVFTKKNNNISLEKCIMFSNMKLIYNLTNIGLLLISSIENTDSNFKLNDFYENIALVLKKLTNVKKLVDDSTETIWTSIITNSIMDKEYRAIMISQVKRGKIGKDEFNYVTSIHSPLLDYILEKEKDNEKITELLGVKVRPKDVGIIKAILTFMLNGITEEEGSKLAIGSNSEYAGLESFLTLYITIADYFNEVTESCKKLDEDYYKEAVINLKLKLEDLKYLPDLKRSAIAIPSEKSLDKTSSLKDRINNTRDMLNEPIKKSYITQVEERQEVYPVQDERYNVVEPKVSNFSSLMAKITGMKLPQSNNIPDVNEYGGPRRDLHVSNIYNEAPRYRNERESIYNPSGRTSRLSDVDSYVPASERYTSRPSSLYGRDNDRSGYQSRLTEREPVGYRSRLY